MCDQRVPSSQAATLSYWDRPQAPRGHLSEQHPGPQPQGVTTEDGHGQGTLMAILGSLSCWEPPADKDRLALGPSPS